MLFDICSLLNQIFLMVDCTANVLGRQDLNLASAQKTDSLLPCPLSFNTTYGVDLVFAIYWQDDCST